jgi:hypothetical protein
MIIHHYNNVMKKLSNLTEAGHTTINVFNLSRSFSADALSSYVSGSALGCINEDVNGFDSKFVRAIQHSSDTYFENRNPFLLWRRRLAKLMSRSLPHAAGNEMLDEISVSTEFPVHVFLCTIPIMTDSFPLVFGWFSGELSLKKKRV